MNLRKIANNILKLANYFKILSNNEETIYDNIKTYKEKFGSERNKAFLKIVNFFKPKINKIVDQFIRKNPRIYSKLRDEVEQTVLTSVMKILNEVNIDRYKTPGELVSFISMTMDRRLNRTGIEIEMAVDPLVGGGRKKNDLNIGIKKYRQKYNKMPDFKDDDDIDLLAGLMNTKPESVKLLINLFSDEIKQESDDDDQKSIADTLVSTWKTPEENIQLKEYKREILNELDKLSKIEKDVFLMFFDPYNEFYDLSVSQIAQKMKLNDDDIKKILRNTKEKLQNSKVLKELVANRNRRLLIKVAKKLINA